MLLPLPPPPPPSSAHQEKKRKRESSREEEAEKGASSRGAARSSAYSPIIGFRISSSVEQKPTRQETDQRVLHKHCFLLSGEISKRMRMAWKKHLWLNSIEELRNVLPFHPIRSVSIFFVHLRHFFDHCIIILAIAGSTGSTQ